jgi:hypothetical protein
LTGVTGGQQLLRAVSGRVGLITEEKILKLLLLYANEHQDAPSNIFLTDKNYHQPCISRLYQCHYIPLTLPEGVAEASQIYRDAHILPK